MVPYLFIRFIMIVRFYKYTNNINREWILVESVNITRVCVLNRATIGPSWVFRWQHDCVARLRVC